MLSANCVKQTNAHNTTGCTAGHECWTAVWGLHLVVELRCDATKAKDELVVQQYIRLCGLVNIRLLKVKE
jgi:hypothetical protein